MASVKITKETFNGRDGQPVEFERLVLSSDKQKDLVLELRLDKTQLTLAKAILATDNK